VERHPQVSAWFPLLLMIYPVWETLFSIYRKKFLRRISPFEPDGLHLHMLVHKRLIRRYAHSKEHKHRLYRNNSTSPYLWMLTIMCVIPATAFNNNTGLLMGFCTLFVATYLWIYWSIVHFRVPHLLILKGRNTRRQPAEI